MKGYLFSVLLCCLGSEVSASILFTDNFDDPAYTAANWTNTRGNWSVYAGQYYAQAPTNSPLTYTAVQNLTDLTDYTVNTTVNNLVDGGIWLRSSYNADAVSGVLLVTGGSGWANDGFYWHIVHNDAPTSSGIGVVSGLGIRGTNVPITITVIGDTYSLYIQGQSAPITQLKTNEFSSGGVGLYDFYPSQSFSHFSVASAVPLPGAIWFFGTGISLSLVLKKNRITHTPQPI